MHVIYDMILTILAVMVHGTVKITDVTKVMKNNICYSEEKYKIRNEYW